MLSPKQKLSENDPEYEKWKRDQAMKIQSMTDANGPFQCPIDLNIQKMTVLELPVLNWFNYDQPPVKMKITNSGHTVIVSAKWGQERPYISNGPLLDGGYVFSQMHFHWGETDNEGSEHTVDGTSFPMEMHVVHFKSCYLTQESALREKDGMITMVYFFKLQSKPNPDVTGLVDSLQYVQKPHTSARISPVPLTSLVTPFNSDYFLYWGSVMTSTCSHLILWFISREPVGISSEQLAKFRMLSDIIEEPMMRNFRETQPSKDSSVFHISPSSCRATTLLPITQSYHPGIFHPEPNYSQADQTPVQDVQDQRNTSSTSNSLAGAAVEQSGVAQRGTYNAPKPKMVPVYREMAPKTPNIKSFPIAVSYNQPFIYTADPVHGHVQHPVPFTIPVETLYNTGHQNMYGYAPMMIPSYVEGTETGRHSNNIPYGIYYNKKESNQDVKSRKELDKPCNPQRKLPTHGTASRDNQINSFPLQTGTYTIKDNESSKILPSNSNKYYKNNIKFNKHAGLDSDMKLNIEKHQDHGVRLMPPKDTSSSASPSNKGPWYVHTPPKHNIMPQSCKEAKYYSMTDSNSSQGPFA